MVSVDRRTPLQHGLGELGIIEADVAQDRLFKILAAAEPVALQYVLDPAVEPLHHAICLRAPWRGQAVVDAELGAEQVKLVGAGGGAAAEVKETVGEFLAVARQEVLGSRP